MTVVRECPICHHTSLSHVGTLDPKFKQTVGVCQVPVRSSLPGQPGVAMMTPCNCNGKGEPTQVEPPAPLPELPICFNPGCTEFVMPNSSFCSVTCRDEMAAILENMGKENHG